MGVLKQRTVLRASSYERVYSKVRLFVKWDLPKNGHFFCKKKTLAQKNAIDAFCKIYGHFFCKKNLGTATPAKSMDTCVCKKKPSPRGGKFFVYKNKEDWDDEMDLDLCDEQEAANLEAALHAIKKVKGA